MAVCSKSSTKSAQRNPLPPRESSKPPTPRSTAALLILAGILILAGLLRIPGLTQAPPGLNQDEASTAWNAWCLLKTGQDQVGVRWPIFYVHALGENRTTLYMYLTIPFQALGGLNVWTTRLPAAVGGVLTVLLTYWIAARCFSRTTGLIAAGLLAVNPWHIQLSRFGHDASVGPLLTAVTLSALIWAGFPLASLGAKPRAWRALLAGLAVGVCCYGYPAARLFVPLFLLVCVLLTFRPWWSLLRSRGGILALGGLIVGLGLTFGPLAYQHLAHAELISRRGEAVRLWNDEDPVGQRVAKVLGRYSAHFGPDFLFVRGDHHEIQWAQGFGVLDWYTLPLLLAGLGYALWHVRDSRSARVTLCWLALYPIGDSFYRGSVYQADDGTRHPSLHALRSAPGLGGPILLAALGAAAIHRRLWTRRSVALAAYGVLAVVVIGLDGRFLDYYFRVHPRRPAVQLSFQPDLVDAATWLRPHVSSADAVLVTTTRMNMPYVVMLVVLGYDATQWFRDERVVREVGGWNRYYRVGKLYFLYPESAAPMLDGLRQGARDKRAFFVLRPGEMGLANPVHTTYGPTGEPALIIYDTHL